jgi:hypothetical protein
MAVVSPTQRQHFTPQKHYFSVFGTRLWWTPGPSATERLGKWKFTVIIGTRNRDLPACSIAPQPFILPQARIIIIIIIIIAAAAVVVVAQPLFTHRQHKHTPASIPRVGFELTTPVFERANSPMPSNLDRANQATVIRRNLYLSPTKYE